MTAVPAARRLYLLDDNADFRATAKWWLSGAGYEVFDFEDARLALDALKALAPEEIARACLLLDVRMPVMSGLQVHDELIACGVTGAKARPALPVVYMTGHGDVPLAVKAMEKGAVTFLEKPFQDSALESALARAFELGGAPARADLAVAVGEPAEPPCLEYARRLATLSRREVQVLEGVVDGKISKVIARELDISTKTVELHRSHVMAKMQAESLVHLTRMVVARRVS
ncbi:MAG: LuxR C-terminal-related transcriptional regulator [Ottowia sp.]|uniref:response regulator transcription factor n=1 Tax=Ottowia sp. TaxID=1898956 RepID=UPI0039E4AC4A